MKVLLLSLLVALMLKTNAQECALSCPANAPCKIGTPDFITGHAPLAADGKPMFIHDENEEYEATMHCDCPAGWTGVKCDHIFDSCSLDHACYHGGVCKNGLLDKYGNKQHFCDCSLAHGVDSTDGETRFIGKYCETPYQQYCDDDKVSFCVHGGECNPEYPDKSHHQCICPDGYEGVHCEFKEGSVPECTLDCGEGDCVIGIATPEEADEMYHFWNTDESKAHMRCICPPGMDGPNCEATKVPCGDAECFHGGTCTPIMVNGKEEHHCDCTSAYDETDLFAGRYCQYKSTSFCTQPIHGSHEGQQFCVNGGKCKDNPHEGCECPVGFGGFKCEFRIKEEEEPEPEPVDNTDTTDNTDNADDFDGDDSEQILDKIEESIAEDEESRVPYDDSDYVKCKLDCQNGGKCSKGAKSYNEQVEEAIKDSAHLNITYSDEFEHCVCPSGFVGLECEHEIVLCQEGEHVCLHGSSCTPNSESCDCTEADGLHAGDSCQHKATDICTTGEPHPGRPLYFCVNQGTCLDYVGAEATEHPGCMCADGWDGPHCEVRKGAANKSKDDVEQFKRTDKQRSGTVQDEGKKLFLVFLGMIAFTVAALLLTSFYLRSRGKGQSETCMPFRRRHSQMRRLDDNERENLAPKRESRETGGDGDDDDGPAGLIRPSSGFRGSATSGFRGSSSSDPFALRGDDEPSIVLAPRDEDGHELHNVEII